jgi:hypothetical protein
MVATVRNDEARGKDRKTGTPAHPGGPSRSPFKARQASLGIRGDVVAEVNRSCAGQRDEAEHLVDPVAFALFEPGSEPAQRVVEASETLREELDPTPAHEWAGAQHLVMDEGANYP